MNVGIHNLGKSYGPRSLFEGVDLQLNAGSRYGLIGANGSGKTTFLRILAGDEAQSEGTLTIPREARVGVLRQDRFLNDDEPIRAIAMQGDAAMWAALEEQARLAEAATPDPERVAELEEFIAQNGGYTLEARASAVLQGLGIPVAVHENPLGTLSGGFKLRVLLAQVLLGRPDLLLLDEPTNHLDIVSIRWLETFLAAYAGCAVVISHDQRFLDRVTSHVLDVDFGTITLYTGNLTSALEQKRLTRERKEAEIARAEKIIAEKRAFVERFGAKATKAKQAQSRLRQIEKIEVDTLEASSRRAPRFLFEQTRPSGKDVLEVEELSKSYGEKHVLRGVSMTLRRGERLAVIGANGLGKSTLLKVVTGRLASERGLVKWGHETHVGYFAQDHRELLDDPNVTALDLIWNLVPTETTAFVRGRLGRVLFSGEDVEKKVGVLSGGEAARLVFCSLMVQKPNVLILDEPTNHLDLESIEALIQALKSYEGTVLFVSHDRYFVGALATRILEVNERGFQDFPGSYDEYLARAGADHLDAEAVLREAAKAKADAKSQAPKERSREEQKRRNNRKKALPGLRDKVLADIEAAEERRRAIEASYCEPGFFDRTSSDTLANLRAEDEVLKLRLEELVAEWERLETELAELDAAG
jgi:ATPase subunit of ABC transporter with duplicated ATPase domains